MLDPSGIPIPSHDQNQNVSRHCQKVPWETELPQVETIHCFILSGLKAMGWKYGVSVKRDFGVRRKTGQGTLSSWDDSAFL